MSEQQPLMKPKPVHEHVKEEYIAKAFRSECGKHIDTLFKDRDSTDVEKLKHDMFEQVFETMGNELEPEDIARALVVRNERFGRKTAIFFTIITLGLFLCIRPRDDDIVCVCTRDGTVVKLKVERTPCCPRAPNAILFAFLRFMAILFLIVILPNMIFLLITGKSFQDELHDLHLDTDGYKDLPALAKRNYKVTAIVMGVLLFWLCSLIPHDYRDKHRRRHMSREVAVGQFTLSGCRCRRRSTMCLYFGKYPSQAVLDFVGRLDIGSAVAPVPPSDLSATAGLSPSKIIMGLTLFLSLVTGMDTAFAWLDRTIALEHFAKMQEFCIDAPGIEGKCTQTACEAWAVQGHVGVSTTFCSLVEWSHDEVSCKKYGHDPPCCSGCGHGGFASYLDEGTMATFKATVSLFADTGTVLFTLLAARYAMGIATATDNIDVLIKRRSRKTYKTETANFDFTVPLALAFMEAVFGRSRTQGVDNRSQARRKDRMAETTAHGASKAAPKWCGIDNFELDDELENWKEFFKRDNLSPPDTRWTSKVKVPRRLLGIHEEEQVLAAWVELPLLPPAMSAWDLMTGGIWWALLPFGKTRHAVVVTDQRIFYVRHRRPSLPLPFLGTDLRFDAYRHDHDVIFGRMHRTKLSFINRLVHQKLLFENFLPGVVVMQTSFGAIQLVRGHGDVLDVYHLVMQLSRNTAKFINKQDIEKAGVVWDRCQTEVKKVLTRKSGRVWEIQQQPDDGVEPKPDIYLCDSEKEFIIFHLTFKDVGSPFSGMYTNADMILTTGRIFFWERKVHKKFDCQALLCWLTCWMAILNPMFAARNLPNSASFVTLPSILSFSTDLSVDPPSWLVPHHTPLKLPCAELLCSWLTRLFTRDGRPLAGSITGCCPRRSGASALLGLMWRLKQSSHADSDMILQFGVKPYVLEDLPEADAKDIYSGLGNWTDTPDAAAEILRGHDEKVETLRKIMCVVQDACHRFMDKVDELV